MTVSATEFKTNFGKYLEMSSSEDIYITKNGKNIAVVSNPQLKGLELFKSLSELVANSEITSKSFEEIQDDHMRERYGEYFD